MVATTMLSGVADTMRATSWRRQMAQFVQMLHVIAMALAVWKGLGIVTNSESPVVVVLSGSMEPAFHRGDLLFLTMGSKPIEVGEITVYSVPGTEIPIVHRVIETRPNPKKKHGQLLLTKGDNNHGDDIMLYKGPRWIRDDQIVGRVQGYVDISLTVTDSFPMLAM